ncbi:MAG: signal recognition particle protein [Nitrospirae bacterium]|nr:signal recognition particle protein [Nitrospirota bacterium]
MFEALSEKLEGVFKKLRGRGLVREEDVTAAMKEVRLALLEADVNFRAVKDFVEKVRARAVGSEVLDSLTPGQQVVKIVYDELVALMGGAHTGIQLSPNPPTVIMMAGLQGSGKTTSSAKLAKMYKREGRRPLLVAADTQRPAAITQLQTLGAQIGVPVHATVERDDPVRICKDAVKLSKTEGYDIVILDTAGRLQIDDELMDQLQRIKAEVSPQEVLLVADAMTGQEAVNIADSFDKKIGLTGVALTKMDGDARGGAALSIMWVTGKPVKFMGVGEKLDPLEPFHPPRMASRILGMGDVLSLIEKAKDAVEEKQAQELAKKIQTDSFTLDDLLNQMRQMRKMGPIQNLLGMIPGLGAKMKDVNVDEKQLGRIEAIISSMTRRERADYAIINGSRRRRIANGSGTTVAEVNRLLKQYMEMRKMMKMFRSGGMRGMKMPGLPKFR